MTSLIRLDSPDDPCVGGVACTFPSGACKAASWRSERPIVDTLAVAKDVAAKLLQTCLDERRVDDAERTNWVSVTAAVQRCVSDFNRARADTLRVVDNSH